MSVDDGTLSERLSNLEEQIAAVSEIVQGGNDKNQGGESREGASERIESLVRLAGGLLATLAGLVGVFYGFGYVIVNSHLFSYGVKVFELTRPNYLVAGVVFCVFHLFAFGWPAALAIDAKDFTIIGASHDMSRVHRKALQMAILSAILGAVMLSMILPLSNMRAFIEILNLDYLQYLGILALASASLTISVSIRVMRLESTPGSTQLMSWHAIGPWMFFLLSVVTVLSSWSTSIYPAISPVYGGGQAVNVQLVIDSEETENDAIFDALGIDLDENLSEPLALLDESQEAMVLVLESGDAVRLDRSVISHVIYRDATVDLTNGP